MLIHMNRLPLVLSISLTLLFNGCSKTVPPDYRIELGRVARESVFSNDTMSIWGGSLVKGEDGLYHMFYSRWPKKLGWVWVSHSEIAHAVSVSPFRA